MVLFGFEFRKYKNYMVKNDMYVESPGYVGIFLKLKATFHYLIKSS